MKPSGVLRYLPPAALAFAAMLMGMAPAGAQIDAAANYPSKPMRMVVPLNAPALAVVVV